MVEVGVVVGVVVEVGVVVVVGVGVVVEVEVGVVVGVGVVVVVEVGVVVGVTNETVAMNATTETPTLPGGVEWRERSPNWFDAMYGFARAWNTTATASASYLFKLDGCSAVFEVVRNGDFYDIHALGTRPAWVKRGEGCDAG